MKEVKAIIFDMDGLMLDTERLFMQAYQRAAIEHGHELSKALYLRMLGHKEEDSNRILEEGLPGAPTHSIVRDARNYYHTLILENGIDVQPGLVEFIDFLDEVKMPRGVATSTHYELACSKLQSVRLLQRMDSITCGDQVENGKPAPDIFLKAAGKLDVPPENCVVLEDSLSGLKGAHAAGMMPVLIPDLLAPTDEMKSLAQAVFPSLIEFHECFKAIR